MPSRSSAAVAVWRRAVATASCVSRSSVLRPQATRARPILIARRSRARRARRRTRAVLPAVAGSAVIVVFTVNPSSSRVPGASKRTAGDDTGRSRSKRRMRAEVAWAPRSRGHAGSMDRAHPCGHRDGQRMARGRAQGEALRPCERRWISPANRPIGRCCASALAVPGHHVGSRRLIGGWPPSALWRRSLL